MPQESTMLALGTQAPDFALPSVITGEPVSLDDFMGKKALLVMFICRHCPYVIHVQEELARIGHDYVPQNVGIVAISANDAQTYPDDAPAHLAEMASSLGFNFPFCYDESQAVARAYTAQCTPEFFLFDEQKKLCYHGQLDDTRPNSERPATGADLRAAIDAVLVGKPVPADQKPAVGCSIKWKV